MKKIQIIVQKPQLEKVGRDSLVKNVIDRITAATKAVKEIMEKNNTTSVEALPETYKKDVKYLLLRIEQLQISYRLFHDTNWISTIRVQQIQLLKESLVKTNLLPHQVRNYQYQLKAFESGQCCKICRGHGYVGEKISTGEYKLCNCVMNYIGAYKQL